MMRRKEQIAVLEDSGYLMQKERGYALPFRKELLGITLFLSSTKNKDNDGIIIHPGYEQCIPIFEVIEGVNYRNIERRYFHIPAFYEFPKRVLTKKPIHYGLEIVVDNAKSFEQFLLLLEDSNCVSNDILEQENFEHDINKGNATESQALRSSRVGQGLWRKKLDLRWGECALTGCNVRELLRGSHIRAWADCSNKDRLDVDNGLLLRIDVDALFDKHLITLENNGDIVISKYLETIGLEMIPFDIGGKVVGLNKKNMQYLKHHRSKFKEKDTET